MHFIYWRYSTWVSGLRETVHLQPLVSIVHFLHLSQTWLVISPLFYTSYDSADTSTQYTSTPVHQFTSTPVLQYTSTPVLQYSSSPVLQYSSTPVFYLWIINYLQYLVSRYQQDHLSCLDQLESCSFELTVIGTTYYPVYSYFLHLTMDSYLVQSTLSPHNPLFRWCLFDLIPSCPLTKVPTAAAVLWWYFTLFALI